MRCPNPQCGADLMPEDRHCPRCGTAVPAAPGPPSRPGLQPVPDRAPGGPQRVSPRAVPRHPVAREGQSYPALVTYAALMVKTGSFLKWWYIGLGVLCCVYAIVVGVQTDRIVTGVIVGVILLGLSAAFGWLQWLGLAVVGEFVYLLLDVTKVFVSSQRRE